MSDTPALVAPPLPGAPVLRADAPDLDLLRAFEPIVRYNEG